MGFSNDSQQASHMSNVNFETRAGRSASTGNPSRPSNFVVQEKDHYQGPAGARMKGQTWAGNKGPNNANGIDIDAFMQNQASEISSIANSASSGSSASSNSSVTTPTSVVPPM